MLRNNLNKKLQPQKTQKSSQSSQNASAPQRLQPQRTQSKTQSSQNISEFQLLQEKYPLSDLTEKIIGIAIEIHKQLGAGFTEKIYQRALYLDLKKKGIKFEREKKISIYYKNANLGYEKVDFDIEEKIILELKAVSDIQPLHKAQLISYLKASGRKIGLILNFAKEKLEIKRVINTASTETQSFSATQWLQHSAVARKI